MRSAAAPLARKKWSVFRLSQLQLETDISDRAVYDRAVRRFRDAGILLPRFSELADPARIPESVVAELTSVDPDAPHARNLFRVHWYNRRAGGAPAATPEYLALPSELTGVDARILVALGDRFPMIGAHKVLAAYACLAPRIITGRFDPTTQHAIWPSTGNYCRGGVAVSRIMGCRGVAVLPQGMSRERFEWLERWVGDPGDILRTPGSESNVREIYQKCAELSRDPRNVIFNQFAEFGNYLAHYCCTGPALERVFAAERTRVPELRLRAFVSATGSAGTLAAGDHLKERFGAKIVAAEALQCPTLLCNGYGEHNIQGIGDKHVPLIHNVMNTDYVAAVSDRSTDALGLLFNTPEGHDYLARRRSVSRATLAGLASLGLSSICNVLAAVKVAKSMKLGGKDAIVTVATDGARMYGSERERALRTAFPAGVGGEVAGEIFGQHMLGASTDHLLELTREGRDRIFNLGYFTWVEQLGVPLADFEARRAPEFWTGLRGLLPLWDARIEEFNRRTVGA